MKLGEWKKTIKLLLSCQYQKDSHNKKSLGYSWLAAEEKLARGGLELLQGAGDGRY
jgi:hypothetical protein